jgi:hypothetical protein
MSIHMPLLKHFDNMWVCVEGLKYVKCRGGVVAPLNLCIRWRLMFSFTPQLLCPIPFTLLNRRLCGPQFRSGRFGGKKNFLALPAI